MGRFDKERAWIEIDIENLRHNVAEIKKAMPLQCELMAVVKAEAYGHGSFEICSNLNKMGVTAFAVATIEEGIRLRKFGICGEILILGYTNVNRASELKKYDLTQTLISYEYAEALNEKNLSVKSHIKIDTGMHRLGIPVKESESVKKLFTMQNLDICGIYTHLCCAASRAPEDITFTRRQIDSFYRLSNDLKASGIRNLKQHIQSSYGFLNYPELICDYIRTGIALYGVYSTPCDKPLLKLDLRPVLSLKSQVVLIRSVEKGEGVGYDRSFITARKSRIGIIPVGYGDGFPRNLSQNGSVKIGQYIVPIAGKICMDQLAVDITDTKDIQTGDIVTLIGNAENLSADVVSNRAGSISNELLCRMGARLPVVVKMASES